MTATRPVVARCGGELVLEMGAVPNEAWDAVARVLLPWMSTE